MTKKGTSMDAKKTTINITYQLFEAMQRYSFVNWSGICRNAIQKEIDRLKKEEQGQ